MGDRKGLANAEACSAKQTVLDRQTFCAGVKEECCMQSISGVTASISPVAGLVCMIVC